MPYGPDKMFKVLFVDDDPAGAEAVSLYLRHGFEIIGNIQVGSSPTLVPMLRRPR